MKFQVTKSEDIWTIRPYYSGKLWEVKALLTPDTYLVNVSLMPIGDVDEESLLTLALGHGIRWINQHIKLSQWRKDFGQL